MTGRTTEKERFSAVPDEGRMALSQAKPRFLLIIHVQGFVDHVDLFILSNLYNKEIILKIMLQYKLYHNFRIFNIFR